MTRSKAAKQVGSSSAALYVVYFILIFLFVLVILAPCVWREQVWRARQGRGFRLPELNAMKQMGIGGEGYALKGTVGDGGDGGKMVR